ncbi:ABC transporter permease [Paenibacillus sp. MBLB4367]|uniref:ABC transporter permease n=1 Tax=Paenibacillus sp. MBLB4367 TaxID=3384767 RepID=UPI003908438A
MVLYAFRRLLNAIPILIGITIISFIFVHMAPGGPLSQIAEDPTIKAVDKENLIKAYGLDKPLTTQYWDMISGMVQGDFGTSFFKNEPVSKVILDRLPNTLLLTVTSFIIAMLIGIPIGIICALKPNSRFDQIVSGITFAGISLPTFWLAILLIMFFAVKLGWLPSGGLKSLNGDFSLADRIKHLILPMITMAVGELAVWTRYIRSSMMEIVNQDYMRTARAKGLKSSRILVLHGFRNALIPLATLFGLAIPSFFGGALFTETVFSIPGMGRLFTEAAFQRDYPIIFAINTIVAFLTVFGNIIADVLIAALDPRVSLGNKEVKV